MEKIDNSKVLEYQKIVGEYISLTCKLEHMVHVFLIEHYTGYDEKLTEEFIRDFLSKKDTTFSGTLKMFRNILNGNDIYSKSIEEKKEVIGEKSMKRIVKYRNILAHASFNGISDEQFEFLWLNDDYKKSIYVFRLTTDEILQAYKDLAELNNFTAELVSPILKREMEKQRPT